MFREDISGYSEPPRPPRKKMTPWVPIVLVAFVGLGVAHVAGLTEPIKSVAMQLTGSGRTPGYRLVGDWESIDDPMFTRVCHLAPKEGYDGMGLYIANMSRGQTAVMFKITSEDRSGRHVEMDEYVTKTDTNYRVRYSIAEDGKSMTREYDGRDGVHYVCQYRYLGPPSEDPPRQFLH